MSEFGVVRLKKGRTKSVERRHPWIFSGAIESEPTVACAWVRVEDATGRTIAFGQHNPHSQIRVRVWSVGEDVPDPASMIRDRLKLARDRRRGLLHETDAIRYVNAEGDFLPGIVLDKYGDTLVLQLLTAGADQVRDPIVESIRANFDEPRLFEKSVGRAVEGLPDRDAPLYGGDPPAAIRIRIGGDRFDMDVRSGHKTGFYLDQRLNIRRMHDFLQSHGTPVGAGARLLDAFCYSGSFGISLRDLFERVTFVDSSSAALQSCKQNWTANGADAARAEFIPQDVFEYLRRTDIGDFNAAVIDPPSFARSRREVDGACRGYKDIQRLAMKRIRPGGFLAAFGCSQHIDADLFQKIVFAAAVDAKRQAQILMRFGPDIDHPVSIDHPEGDYLKGLLLRII